MPQVTVYVRDDDLDKWKAIKKKSQWLSDHLADDGKDIAKALGSEHYKTPSKRWKGSDGPIIAPPRTEVNPKSQTYQPPLVSPKLIVGHADATAIGKMEAGDSHMLKQQPEPLTDPISVEEDDYDPGLDV